MSGASDLAMSGASDPPVLFVSHGGGPSFLMEWKKLPWIKGMDIVSDAAAYLRVLAQEENISEPKAVLVLSAHWVDEDCSVQSVDNPPLYFDYKGMPDEAYTYKWPVKGSPSLAARVLDILKDKGIKCKKEEQRGLDHGVFVPLMVVYPKPKFPVFQVSLLNSMDFEEHLKIGEALSAIRKEGVLIIGSGFCTHNLTRNNEVKPEPWAVEFKEWLHDVFTNPDYSPEDRRKRLVEFSKTDKYRKAHPRPDHFLPAVMACGAAGYTHGRVLYSEFIRDTTNLFEHYLFE